MDAVLTTIGREVEQLSNSSLRLQRSTEAPESLTALFEYSLAYLIFGTVLILANTSIFINILRHRVLRAKKEYLLLAGLTGADMLAGWSTLIAGAYRLHLIAIGEANSQVTPWDCVKTPQVIILAYSFFIQAGMVLLISLDRLIAVARPLQYNIFTRKYSIYMLAGCNIPSALFTAFLLAYLRLFDDGPNEPTINAICFNKDVDLFKYTFVYTRIMLGFPSVIIYVFVWILYRKHSENMQAAFSTMKNRSRSLQRHLSVTVGICSLFTFVFYILPTGVNFTDIDGNLWLPLYWLLNCCSAIVNVFVYSLRHEDIRCGLKFLLMGKELPTPAEQRLQNEHRVPLSVTGRAAIFIIKAMSPTIPAHIIPRRSTASTSTCSTVISK